VKSANYFFSELKTALVGGSNALKSSPMQLELLCPGALVAGILPQATVSVTGVKWRGPDSLELFWQDAAGRTDAEMLGRAVGSQKGRGSPLRLVNPKPLNPTSRAHMSRFSRLFSFYTRTVCGRTPGS